MRDIRSDLQDRASLLEEQISAHEAQFDKIVEQLRVEHEGRLEDLKAEFAAVTKLMELEQRRIGIAPAPKAHAPQPQPQPVHQPVHQPAHQSAHQPAPQASQPPQPLADFLVRKMSEVGAMSRDDLRRLTLQEGYFADAESAERGVTGTLLNVVKAGLIRQLPNGNFAPATVLDTIRLRRAM
jgi:hypothetical protein